MLVNWVKFVDVNQIGKLEIAEDRNHVFTNAEGNHLRVYRMFIGGDFLVVDETSGRSCLIGRYSYFPDALRAVCEFMGFPIPSVVEAMRSHRTFWS